MFGCITLFFAHPTLPLSILQIRARRQSVCRCRPDRVLPAFSGRSIPDRRCCRVRSWQNHTETRCVVTLDKRSRCDSRLTAQPSDALLYQVATQLGIDEATFGPRNGFAQPHIVESFSTGKACKHFGREDPQPRLQYSPYYNPWGHSS